MADTRTIKELASECAQAMDACNLVAVLSAAADSISRLRELVGDWQAANQHPITICWVDKIAQLAGGYLWLDNRPDMGSLDIMHCYHQIQAASGE